MKNFLNRRGLNLSTFFKKIKEVDKAYTEGIYADTPQNRKLGRVGMSYADYHTKLQQQEEEKKEETATVKVEEKEQPIQSKEEEKEEQKQKSTEGVYADTPANRKLDRVGMTYAEYNEKIGNFGDISTIDLAKLKRDLDSKNIEYLEARDRGEFFSVTFDKVSSSKPYLQKVKEYFEKRGAKVYVNEDTYAVKAYKKFEDVENIEQETFNVGNYEFDYIRQTLTHDDGTVDKLSAKENELVKLFLTNSNKLVPREIILEKIWGDNNPFTSRSLDVYITKLRKLFSKNKGIQLLSFHGKGFKFITPKEEKSKTLNIINNSSILKEAKGDRLDAIIRYSNSSEEEGIKIKEDASDEEKRKAIAEFYIKSAELEGSEQEIADDLDSIIEEALIDYVNNTDKKDKGEKEMASKMKKENILRTIRFMELDAEELANRVEEENRDFTEDERADYEGLLEGIERLKKISERY